MGRNIRVQGFLGYCLKSDRGVLSGRVEQIFEKDAWFHDQFVTLIDKLIE
jgi:cellulase/cellobiase CelA1